MALAADPATLVLLVLAVVAVHSTPSVWAAAAWCVLAATFCVGLPYVVLVLMIGRGVVLDRHVVVRHERRWPLLASLCSVAIGLGLLARLGAPRAVVAVVVAMLAGLAAMTALSQWYKASFHAATASGASAMLFVVLGAWTLPATLSLLALVSWARVRSGRHTVGQVILGLLVGGVAALLVFPPLA